MYSTFNSREDYVTLLEGLEHLMTELRDEVWQKRQRKKKKEKEMRFNHGPANVPPQLFPNMGTRSRKATSVGDLPSLTLRSHLRPGSFLSEEAEPSSVPNVANKQSELAVINHKKAMPMLMRGRPRQTLECQLGPN